MDLIDVFYVLFSSTVILSGLVMAGMAVQAYASTERKSMIYLSIGFTLIVGAVTATTISGFISDFHNPRTLLTVNYFVMTLGFVSVIASLYVD